MADQIIVAMKPQFVYAPFERYADDMVVHCSTLTQAEHILGKIKERMIEYGLEIHPDKTKIVYCMQEKRRKQQPDYVEYKFDFLGYGFKTRTNLDKVRNKFIKPRKRSRTRDTQTKDIYNYTSYSDQELSNILKNKIKSVYFPI